MAIERKVVTGTGAQIVDVAGWSFAKVETDGYAITISLVGNGGYSKDFADDDRIIIPSSITSLNVNAPTGRSWKLYMQKTVPAINQSEVQFSITGDGKLIISGDDDISFIGEPTAATADINGVKPDLENLSKLYMTAVSNKTTTNCAKYCRLRTAVLARYTN